jgi:hypothetical protein
VQATNCAPEQYWRLKLKLGHYPPQVAAGACELNEAPSAIQNRNRASQALLDRRHKTGTATCARTACERSPRGVSVAAAIIRQPFCLFVFSVVCPFRNWSFCLIANFENAHCELAKLLLRQPRKNDKIVWEKKGRDHLNDRAFNRKSEAKHYIKIGPTLFPTLQYQLCHAASLSRFYDRGYAATREEAMAAFKSAWTLKLLH